MATLAQFSRNIRRQGSSVENSATALVKATSLRALKSLVRNTAVDTGVARSNWRVGVGAPTRAVIPAYAPGRKLGIGENANASGAIAAGSARIKSVRGASRGLATAIYISNATPYIERINNGSPTASPAGFIERALQEASAEIKGFRLFQR